MKQQPKSKQPEFLWVNKDQESTSLSRSDKAERHRIFHFVQKRSHARRQSSKYDEKRGVLVKVKRNTDTRSLFETIRHDVGDGREEKVWGLGVIGIAAVFLCKLAEL